MTNFTFTAEEAYCLEEKLGNVVFPHSQPRQ